MMERRSVLKLGAAGVAGALFNFPLRAFGTAPLCRAVFDERFEECRAFAGEMDRRGVVTSGIRGDVAKLWYEDLRVRLRQDPAPIAGLTDRVALFCLEELARDVGMRVFFRVDHVAGVESGRAMAVRACGYDMSGCGDIAAQKRTGPFSPENKAALVSWVIG